MESYSEETSFSLNNFMGAIRKIKNTLNENKEFCFLLFIFNSLAIYLIDRNSLWLDETFSVIMTSSFKELLATIVSYESNMWIYYAVLSLWAKFSTNDGYLRLLSVLFANISLYLIFIFTRKIFDFKTAIVSVFLLSINLMFFHYSREARGYTMLLAFTLLSTYLYLKSLTEADFYWERYVLVSLVLPFIHIFGFFVIFSHFFGLFIFLPEHKKWRKWAMTYILLLIITSPVLISVILGKQQANWIQPINLKSITTFFYSIASEDQLILLLYIFPVFIFFQNHVFVRSKDRYGLLILTMFLIPIVCAGYISLIRPIFVPRFLIITLPFFLILISRGISLIKNRWVVVLYLGVIFFISVLKVIDEYYKVRENWRDSSLYVLTSAKPNDGVAFFSFYVRRPFIYYFDKHLNGRNFDVDMLELASAPYAPGGSGKLPALNLSLIEELPKKYHRLWLVLSHNNLKKMGYDVQTNELLSLIDKTYKLKKQKYFPIGIYLRLYEAKK